MLTSGSPAMKPTLQVCNLHEVIPEQLHTRARLVEQACLDVVHAPPVTLEGTIIPARQADSPATLCDPSRALVPRPPA